MQVANLVCRPHLPSLALKRSQLRRGVQSGPDLMLVMTMVMTMVMMLLMTMFMTIGKDNDEDDNKEDD